MKAICLYSGGLDSALAVKIVKELGIEPICVRFITPFIKRDIKPIKEFIKKENLKLIEIEVLPDYIQILKNPKYGFGKNLNPCIDCKIYFFKKAKEIMEREKADLMVTGEVLNQRSMSQRKYVLELIERETNLKGLILRPLSAKLLPPTIFEKEGKIDREKLFSIKGRSRKIQLELARKFFLKDFTSPAGGCLLTQPSFSQRLKDLLTHESDFSLKDLELLKFGKHFRISHNTKLIIPRTKKEELEILKLKEENDFLISETTINLKALLKIKAYDLKDFITAGKIFLDEFKKEEGNLIFQSDFKKFCKFLCVEKNVKEDYHIK